MAVFAWVMISLAIWHFTIFLPDRFWAGIVGAFLGSMVGGVIFGLAVNGGSVPARDATDVLTVLQAVPGAVLGLAAVWAIGVRGERLEDGVPRDVVERNRV